MWGEEARGRLESLAKIVQAEGEQLGDRFAGSSFIQRWQQRIGVTLQRGNAVALIRRSRADMRWRAVAALVAPSSLTLALSEVRLRPSAHFDTVTLVC